MKSFDYEQYALTSARARRWVNQCGGCGAAGVKPGAPAEVLGSITARLRKHLGELRLDDRGMCGLCARLLDERAAR